MKISGIDHIVLVTENLRKCLEFYVNILGMDLDDRNNRYAVRFGNQKINIHCQGTEFFPVARNPIFGSVDICLIAEGSIHDIEEELKQKGVEIELGIVNRTGAMGPIESIYLRDPDGNLVEISVYKNLI